MSDDQKAEVESAAAQRASEAPGLTMSGQSKLPLLPEQFEILEELGKGGMGVVYKAKNRYSNALVAIKILKDANLQKDDVERFKREARTAEAFKHPNAIAVKDFALWNNTPYLVMEYAEGESLDHILKKEGTLSEAMTVSIVMDICSALAAAHAAGVVHRDIKPSNIIVEQKDGECCAKLLDFGLAKLVNIEASQDLTQTGEVIGTPLYMSPEQFQSQKTDARTDVYSIGAVMYQCLSGRVPHKGESLFATMYKCLNHEAESIRLARKSVSASLEKIVLHCLQKRPEDRYQSAADLLHDLSRFAQGKSIAWKKFKLRPRAAIVVQCLTGAIALGLVMWGVWSVSSFFHPGEHPVSAVDTQHVSKPYLDKSTAEWSDEIRKKPKSATAYFGRGRAHELNGDRIEAIDDYRKAISYRKDYPEAQRALARVNTLMSNFDAALSDAQESMKIDPTSDRSYACLAEVYDALEDYGPALENAKKAIAIDGAAENHYVLAHVFFKLENYQEANVEIKRAIAVSPKLAPPAYLGLQGLIAACRQDYASGVEKLESATRSPDAGATEWAELAYCYFCENRADEASVDIDRMRTVDTSPAHAQRLAGELYRVFGRAEQAAPEFSKSISEDQNNPVSFRDKGVNALQLGSDHEAVEAFERAYKLNSRSMLTRSYLLASGSHADKRDALSERQISALLSEPQPALVLANLAAAELAAGNLESARRLADEAVARDKFLSEAYAVRARVLSAGAKIGGGGKRVFENSDDDRSAAKKLVAHFDW